MRSTAVRAVTGAPTPYWDALVFNKLKDRLGGRCRLIITGSAPISAELQKFLRACFGCPVMEGYGLSETCAAGTVTDAASRTVGNVGLPVPCNGMRLAGGWASRV